MTEFLIGQAHHFNVELVKLRFCSAFSIFFLSILKSNSEVSMCFRVTPNGRIINFRLLYFNVHHIIEFACFCTLLLDLFFIYRHYTYFKCVRPVRLPKCNLLNTYMIL